MNFKKAILIFCSVVAFAPSGYSQSVSDSAGTTSSANKSAATMAYLEAAGLFVTSAYEAGQCPEHSDACVIAAVTAAMGMLAVQQGNANNAAAGDAGTTDGESSILPDTTTTSSTTGTSTTTTSGDDATSQAFQAAKAAQQALNTAGVATTSTGATAPDGSTASTSSVGSQAALAGSGLPQSVIDAAMQAATNAEKAAEAKMNTAAVSGFEDGGGSGAGGPPSNADDQGKAGAKKIAKAPVVPKRDPAQMAGLQKNYNGEPIGVAQDDIFLMMSRRYKLKDSQDTFLHENEIMLRK